MKKLFFIMTFSALVASCGNDMPVVELPEIDTTNPLLAEWDTPHATPPFDKIKITDYEPAIETAIAVSRAEVDAIINNLAKPCIIAQKRGFDFVENLSSFLMFCENP